MSIERTFETFATAVAMRSTLYGAACTFCAWLVGHRTSSPVRGRETAKKTQRSTMSDSVLRYSGAPDIVPVKSCEMP